VKKLRVAAKISDTPNPAGESWQGIFMLKIRKGGIR
jgi:hypothetical protein